MIDKGPYSQGYGFSSSHAWMWVLDHKEGWGLKNWCFWTVMLEKTLESLLDCKEIKPVHSKGNSPEYSLEGLMLKLKLQYFGHPVQRPDSLEKTLMLGKIEGRKRRGQQRMRWLDGITDSMDMSLSKLRSWWWTGKPGVLRSMGSQRVGHNWGTELNWTGFNSWVGKTPWRRERLPTPVLWPGEFHRLYSPWDHKESGMTEWLSLSLSNLWALWNNCTI